MAISGNPKKLAQDIADGFFALSPPMLKLYTPADLKIILAHIGIVGRELRGEKIPLEDILALKSRNSKLSRLNQNEVVIRAFCKKHRYLV
ncbi:MAG: hypothetical protein A2005_01025 [Desulfuromonadales bacterium GWC2_61_20]|nr:MAG: hypothetical protein A2005_01025 [Desulfuromonadales bacterium GWC2_61_20]